MLHLTFPGFIYFIAEHLPLTLSAISPPPALDSLPLATANLPSVSVSLLFCLFYATQWGSCDICLSAFFHLAYCPQSPQFCHKWQDFTFYGQIHCLYTPHLLYPFISWWHSGCFRILALLSSIRLQWSEHALVFLKRRLHFLQLNTHKWNCWTIWQFCF